MGELTKSGINPLIPQSDECFIVIPMHAKGSTGAAQWDGPFATKELAQRAAVAWMMRTGAYSMSVFQLVGTIAKPAPDLEWYEPEKKA